MIIEYIVDSDERFERGTDFEQRRTAMLTRASIQEKLHPIFQKYPVDKAYLFGSYSRGEATEKSDIDIRVEGNIKNLFILGGLYEDIMESLDKKVDILTKVPEIEKFRDNLLRDEVLIYERQG